MHCLAWKEPAEPVMPWTRTLLFLFTRIDMFWVPCSRSLGRSDDLLGAVGHAVRRLNGETALGQDLLAELHVGALEAHDQRHLEAELARGRDHAFGDHVALHD